MPETDLPPGVPEGTPPENVQQFTVVFTAAGYVSQGTAAEPPPGQQAATVADNEGEAP